jgi:hypothetical protein
LQMLETIKRSMACQIVSFEDNIQRNLTKVTGLPGRTAKLPWFLSRHAQS